MKIGVIGGGNMGGATARGVVSAGVISPSDLTVSDPSEAVRESFKTFDPAIRTTDDNVSAIVGADVVIVAVKPWLMEQVIGQIAPTIDRERQIIISVAATITFEMLGNYLGGGKIPPLFRAVPNTAISLGESATFVASHGTSEAQVEAVRALFAPLGKIWMVDESLIGAVTALSSSGIAYVFRYIDAAVKGGEELGISRSEGLQIMLQTVRGALAMLEHNDTQPQTEIDKVTTPGGLTLKGLAAMEENGFTHAVIEGLKATK